MKSIAIVSVNIIEDKIHVVKELTDDDGNVTLNLHVFSKETLEWRAAEYNTIDQDLLIDIILYEPFVTEKQVYESEHDPVTARANFISAIQSCKNNTQPKATFTKALPVGFVVSNRADVYDLIKQVSYFDSEALELKTQHVETMLEIKKSILNAQQPVDRTTLLRSRLLTKKES